MSIFLVEASRQMWSEQYCGLAGTRSAMASADTAYVPLEAPASRDCVEKLDLASIAWCMVQAAASSDGHSGGHDCSESWSLLALPAITCQAGGGKQGSHGRCPDSALSV